MNQTPCVRIPRGITVCLRVWGDECVAYNAASSETHLLGTPAGLLLQRLQSGPSTFAALVEGLSEYGGSDLDDVAVYVPDAVRQLANLGLVEIIGSVA